MTDGEDRDAKPSICLTMIVRDEAHIVRELLDSVACHIDYWVVVDTGSADGTQDLVRSHMAALGIPGELHERPWKDFGHNRSEALELCAGKADYAWMLDADDLVVGDLDLSALSEDSYLLRYGEDVRYWRKQLFRDGIAWRYEGVLHEYAVSPPGSGETRLEGSYHVESRRLGARSQDPRKYARDRDLLLEVVKADPEDERAVFYLAQSCFDAGDPESALHWYTRRRDMDGWDEERYCSAARRAECLESLGRPWAEVLEAHLEAFQMRPSRAEPLYEIARRYRLADNFDLAYMFAAQACAIPFPDSDDLFVHAEVYSWRARDELAVAAFHTGRKQEAFEVSRELLQLDGIDAAARERLAANRDYCVPDLLAAAAVYPQAIVNRITARAGEAPADPQVTLTITSCRRPELFGRTMNSFLNCCEDIDRIDRWICVDNGSDEADLQQARELYPFVEFIYIDPDEGRHADGMNRILELVQTPYWLHLEDDWHFFTRERYVGRALEILADDTALAQVAFNFSYGEVLDDRRYVGATTHRAGGDGSRYMRHQYIAEGTPEWDAFLADLPPDRRTTAFWPHFTLRPSLIRVDAIRALGEFDPESGAFELEYARRFEAAGLRTAFFDEIVCLHIGRRTDEPAGTESVSAYELVGDGTHPLHASGDADGLAHAVDLCVINLDRRPDRLSSFRAAAAQVAGPAFVQRCRRFSGVDGRRLVLDEHLRWLFRDNDFGFRRGVLGAALSHIGVWREIATADRPCLIFEDDARLLDGFTERFDDLIATLAREQPETGVLFLGYFPWDENAGDEDPVATSGYVPMRWDRYLGGTWAYVVYPHAAQRLLTILERDGMQRGIDIFVQDKQDEIVAVEAVPALATSPLARPGSDVDSDAQHDMMAAEERGAVAHDSRPPVLASLVPGLQTAELRLDVVPQWPISDASLAADRDGFRMVARTRAPRTVDGVKAASYLVTFDSAAQLTGIDALAHEPGLGKPDYDDVRLFEHDGNWRALATAPGADGEPETVLLTFDGSAVVGRETVTDAACAMVPFCSGPALKAIRFGAELEVWQSDASGSFALGAATPMPEVLRDVVAVTAATAFDDGWLCVVGQRPRGAMPVHHRLVCFDAGNSVVSASQQFSILRSDVADLEKCGGLAQRDGRLLMSFSIGARLGGLAAMDVAETRRMLQPLA